MEDKLIYFPAFWKNKQFFNVTYQTLKADMPDSTINWTSTGYEKKIQYIVTNIRWGKYS